MKVDRGKGSTRYFDFSSPASVTPRPVYSFQAHRLHVHHVGAYLEDYGFCLLETARSFTNSCGAIWRVAGIKSA